MSTVLLDTRYIIRTCTYIPYVLVYCFIRALRAQGKYEYDEKLRIAAWCDMSRVSHQQELGDAMTSDTLVYIIRVK